MKSITIANTLFLSTIALFLGAGCGSATSETKSYGPTVTTSGTLTFTAKDSEKGILSGTFENGGYTILFDVARGEENPLSERALAGAPSHAIDVRICDERHFCFAQRAGGHAFANSDWIADNSEANAPDNDTALKNSKIKKQLYVKLKEIGSKEFGGLEEEYEALLDSSKDVGELNEAPSDMLVSKAPEQGVLALTTVSTASTASTAATGSYTHQHWMSKVRILFGSIVGDHSASYIKVINSSGTVVSAYQTCNHGACGSSSTMNNYCIRNYPNRPITIPINTQCVAAALPGAMHPSDYAGCCTTQYNFTGVSHVCNDDTRLQRDFMIAGGPMSTIYCGDTTLAQYAPSCI